MIVAEDIGPLLAAVDEMAENVDTLRRYAQQLHSSLPAAEPVHQSDEGLNAGPHEAGPPAAGNGSGEAVAGPSSVEPPAGDGDASIASINAEDRNDEIRFCARPGRHRAVGGIEGERHGDRASGVLELGGLVSHPIQGRGRPADRELVGCERDRREAAAEEAGAGEGQRVEVADDHSGEAQLRHPEAGARQEVTGASTEASKAAASPPWTPRSAGKGWIAGAHSEFQGERRADCVIDAMPRPDFADGSHGSGNGAGEAKREAGNDDPPGQTAAPFQRSSGKTSCPQREPSAERPGKQQRDTAGVTAGETATHSPASPAPALPPALIVPAGAPLAGDLPELPPDAPRAPAALSGRQEAYLALIRERAEAGGPTPSGKEFMAATGSSDGYVTQVESVLVKHGLIRVHGSRNTKVYEIVATGTRTSPRGPYGAASPGYRPAARRTAVPTAPAASAVGIIRQAAPPTAPWATWRAHVVYRKPRADRVVGAGGKLF